MGAYYVAGYLVMTQLASFANQSVVATFEELCYSQGSLVYTHTNSPMRLHLCRSIHFMGACASSERASSQSLNSSNFLFVSSFLSQLLSTLHSSVIDQKAVTKTIQTAKFLPHRTGNDFTKQQQHHKYVDQETAVS